jgi:hypothetical protein
MLVSFNSLAEPHLCLPHIINADAAEAGEVSGDGG